MDVRKFWICTLACGLAGVFGCAPGGVRQPDANPAPREALATETPEPDKSSTRPGPLAPDETWETIYLQDARIGYAHTVRERIEEQGRTLWRTTVDHHVETRRFNNMTVQESRIVSVETEQGGLIRYETESRLGGAPVKSMGEVVGGELKMTTTIGDNQRSTHMPWDDAHDGGFDAVTKNVLREPLAPGDRRTLRALFPGLDQPMLATFDLTARDWEDVRIGDETRRLLRVELKQILPGAEPLTSLVWLNERGEPLKMELNAGMELVRSTKGEALAAASGSSPVVDIGFDTVVHLKAPVGNLHEAREVRYLVTLPEGVAAKTFPQSNSQAVTATDDVQVASITVRAVRPGDVSAVSAPPGVEDKEANLLVQSDDPLIKKLAAQAVGDAKTDADKAARIERFVRNYIRQASFSRAFATATEVAASRQGDCTEFAVLTAALARAAGIPARVAIGLVYMHSAGQPGFGFHMWNELFIDGHWIPYDATLGLGGIGGGHLKLSDSHLADGEVLAKILPVFQVMGRLQIEVVSVD